MTTKKGIAKGNNGSKLFVVNATAEMTIAEWIEQFELWRQSEKVDHEKIRAVAEEMQILITEQNSLTD